MNVDGVAQRSKQEVPRSIQEVALLSDKSGNKVGRG